MDKGLKPSLHKKLWKWPATHTKVAQYFWFSGKLKLIIMRSHYKNNRMTNIRIHKIAGGNVK